MKTKATLATANPVPVLDFECHLLLLMQKIGLRGDVLLSSFHFSDPISACLVSIANLLRWGRIKLMKYFKYSQLSINGYSVSVAAMEVRSVGS